MNPRPHGEPHRSVMRSRRDRLIREARNLDPASTLALAVSCLAALDEHGVDYADFQSAQAAGRAVSTAWRRLVVFV